MDVGKGISLDKKFDFKNGVADGFADHVRSSVPLYETMHSMIVNMTEHFINYSDKGNNYFLDVGCSNGDLTRSIVGKYNDAISCIGIDYSNEMIDIAIDNNNCKNLDYECCDITKQESWHYKDDMFNVISMVLTLQFIPVYKRLEVLQNVYKKLKCGGAFMMIEKVIDSDTEINNMYVQQYHNFKESSGLSSQNIVDKDKSLVGVMRPLMLQDNIELLKRAGFKTISMFFAHYNFVGIIAIKEVV